MSRGISRVSELWVEWYKGIGSSPSVEYMERTFGTKWRLSCKESKFFSRRKVIIEYVRYIENSRNFDTQASLEYIENEQGTKSLDAFSKYLVSKKKESM